MLARTDHLFVGKLQLKLQTSVRPMTNNVKRDINCLKDFFIAQQFYITVRNKCKFSKRYEGPEYPIGESLEKLKTVWAQRK